MLPIRDRTPTKTFPFITVLLILVNVAVFTYEMKLDRTQRKEFVWTYGTRPYEISHRVDLEPQIRLPVYVTLLTSMFMHGSALHIFGNMLYLWIFGRLVEDHIGHLRYLLLYLFWGVFADIVHIGVDLNDKMPAIGASGAISGVLGTYLVMFPANRIVTLVLFLIVPFPLTISCWFVLGEWVIYQFASGYLSQVNPEFADNVAYFAHIGGAVAGIMTGIVYRALRPNEFHNEWNVGFD
jgi:membrane associated rhomboid family serine protease